MDQEFVERFSAASSGALPEGFCVGIEGTNIRLPRDTFGPGGVPASGQALAIVHAWLEHLNPMLANNSAWVCIYRWKNDEKTDWEEQPEGRFGIKLYLGLVYDPDSEEDAVEAAQGWNQYSIWALEGGNAREILTGGGGGQSWYTDYFAEELPERDAAEPADLEASTNQPTPEDEHPSGEPGFIAQPPGPDVSTADWARAFLEAQSPNAEVRQQGRRALEELGSAWIDHTTGESSSNT